jgi:hypothetical protein
MACGNLISIGYTIGTKPVVIIPAFPVSSAGTLNGKDYYTWLDPWSEVTLQLFWDGTNWVVTTTANTLEILLFLNLPENDCPGVIGENLFDITEAGAAFEFVSFGTLVENPPDPQCTPWEDVTVSIPALSFPWNVYTVGLNDLADPSSLYIGQSLTIFTHDNPLDTPGVGYYTVGSIVYLSGTTVYHEPGPGRIFVGVVLVDANGTIMIPGINQGYICFEPAPVNPLTPDEECFNILVWNKQCEFAQCVLKYLRMLEFGVNSCTMLEDLKNKRRALKILNCYDTRDIENNTTEYNTITYSEIKKLLNY